MHGTGEIKQEEIRAENKAMIVFKETYFYHCRPLKMKGKKRCGSVKLKKYRAGEDG